MNNAAANQVVVVTSTKSVGVALILTFFFGPLGMLYSTVGGALFMLVVSSLVCILWGAIAANSYNKKLLASGAR